MLIVITLNWNKSIFNRIMPLPGPWVSRFSCGTNERIRFSLCEHSLFPRLPQSHPYKRKSSQYEDDSSRASFMTVLPDSYFKSSVERRSPRKIWLRRRIQICLPFQGKGRTREKCINKTKITSVKQKYKKNPTLWNFLWHLHGVIVSRDAQK